MVGGKPKEFRSVDPYGRGIENKRGILSTSGIRSEKEKAGGKRETNEKYKWFNGSEVLLGPRHTHYRGILAINLKFLLLHLLLL